MSLFLIYVTYLCIGYGTTIFIMSSCHDDYYIELDDDINKVMQEIDSDDDF